MILPIVAAAVGVGSSLLGSAAERSAAEAAKKNAMEAWKKLLIPKSETEERKDIAGDTYYTKAMGALNKGAFAYKGALNPSTLRTLAFGETAAGRAGIEQQVGEADLAYNRNIQAKIAEVQSTPIPAIDPLGIAEAGLTGYFGGKQIEMTQDLSEKYGTYIETLGKQANNFGLGADKAGKSSSAGISTTYFNPELLGTLRRPTTGMSLDINNPFYNNKNKPSMYRRRFFLD